MGESAPRLAERCTGQRLALFERESGRSLGQRDPQLAKDPIPGLDPCHLKEWGTCSSSWLPRNNQQRPLAAATPSPPEAQLVDNVNWSGHAPIAHKHLGAAQHGGPSTCPQLAVQRLDKCEPPSSHVRLCTQLTSALNAAGVPRCQPHLQRCSTSSCSIPIAVATNRCP